MSTPAVFGTLWYSETARLLKGVLSNLWIFKTNFCSVHFTYILLKTDWGKESPKIHYSWQTDQCSGEHSKTPVLPTWLHHLHTRTQCKVGDGQITTGIRKRTIWASTLETNHPHQQTDTRQTNGQMVAFFSLARILGECSNIHSLPVLCFFKVEIRSHTLIPLFMPESVHSGLASGDDCGQVFPDKLWRSSFPDRFPHYAWTAA